MIKHHLRIAWRKLGTNKGYTFIKIAGLAIGVAACLLITLFIQDELSYDQHYAAKGRIYRLIQEYDFRGDHGFLTYFSAPYANALVSEFPEIEQAGRLLPLVQYGAGSNEIRRTDRERSIHEERVVFMDQDLLEILEVKMVDGELKDVLGDPRSVVLTKSKADIHFPEGGAVGKLLIFNEDVENPYKVTGIIEDFPDNSHLNYGVIASLAEKELWLGERESWTSPSYHTYIKVSENSDIARLESKLDLLTEKYYGPALQKEMEIDMAAIRRLMVYHLQPVEDIHLKSSHIEDYTVSHVGDIRIVWLFGIISVLILLIACINYINLSTAKAANSAKEIGLKKVLGSSRAILIVQLLVESVLLSVIAVGFGLLLAWISLPYLNLLLDKSLVLPWGSVWFFTGIIALILLIGLLAGTYPAFYLSAFRPARVLKGSLSNGSKNSLFRNTLVITQFTVFIILIVGTIVINRQMNYILKIDVGFEKDQVILLHGAQVLGKQADAFKNQVAGLPDVSRVSLSDFLPVTGNEMKRFWSNTQLEGRPKDGPNIPTQVWAVDEDYIQTMGMKVVQGNEFTDNRNRSRSEVIINETLAKKLKMGNPIGQRIYNNRIYEIVGVVEDFHFQSFKSKINPLCLVIGMNASVVAIKAKTENMNSLLGSIEGIWNTFSLHQPVRYDFLDDRFEMMYQDVQNTEKILGIFTVLAVFVACLGLFALSAFMAEQRTKEVAIRKILGASMSNIFSLYTGYFLKLILLSLVIGIPISWYVISKWLEDFAYRTEIGWWIFPLVGILAVAMTILTVSNQALKIAKSDPIDHLSER